VTLATATAMSFWRGIYALPTLETAQNILLDKVLIHDAQWNSSGWNDSYNENPSEKVSRDGVIKLKP
jgi:hypothetical protein